MATWFLTHYLGTIIKTVWYWWRHRHIDKLTKLGTNKPIGFFYKDAKQYNGGKIGFSINRAGAFVYP